MSDYHDIYVEHQPESAAAWADRAANTARRATWEAGRLDLPDPHTELAIARTMALVSIAASLARLADARLHPEDPEHAS